MRNLLLILTALSLTACATQQQGYSWSPQQQRMFETGMYLLNRNNQQQRQTTHTTCSKVGSFLNCTTR